LTLLQNPNPQQGLSRFMEALMAYLLLAGNVYLEAVTPGQEPFGTLSLKARSHAGCARRWGCS